MLEHLDPNAIEMHAYPTREVEDDLTARIRRLSRRGPASPA
jgi:hypothetical protein